MPRSVIRFADGSELDVSREPLSASISARTSTTSSAGLTCTRLQTLLIPYDHGNGAEGYPVSVETGFEKHLAIDMEIYGGTDIRHATQDVKNALQNDFFATAFIRELIAKRRNAGEAWPWSQDDYLNTHRATRVDPMDDRFSEVMLKALKARQNLSWQELFMTTMLHGFMRFSHSSWNLTGGVVTPQEIQEQCNALLRAFSEAGKPPAGLFGRMSSQPPTGQGAPDVWGLHPHQREGGIRWYQQNLTAIARELARDVERFQTPKELWERLRHIPGSGIGNFIAWQITLHVSQWSPHLRDHLNDWTYVGASNARPRADQPIIGAAANLYRIFDLQPPANFRTPEAIETRSRLLSQLVERQEEGFNAIKKNFAEASPRRPVMWPAGAEHWLCENDKIYRKAMPPYSPPRIMIKSTAS